MRRELADEQRLFDQRRLIVGLQALLQRGEVELELLVAGQEVGLEELRAEPVARLGHGTAAQLHRPRQVQLLGVAEQVAVVPAGVDVEAEVGRVGDSHID